MLTNDKGTEMTPLKLSGNMIAIPMNGEVINTEPDKSFEELLKEERERFDFLANWGGMVGTEEHMDGSPKEYYLRGNGDEFFVLVDDPEAEAQVRRHRAQVPQFLLRRQLRLPGPTGQ